MPSTIPPTRTPRGDQQSLGRIPEQGGPVRSTPVWHFTSRSGDHGSATALGTRGCLGGSNAAQPFSNWREVRPACFWESGQATICNCAATGINDPKSIDAYLATGNSHSVAAQKCSVLFSLPSRPTVDTACSSSLVAGAPGLSKLVRRLSNGVGWRRKTQSVGGQYN